MAPDALKDNRNPRLSPLYFPLPTMTTSDSYQPLQLKGEVVDMEFTLDTDHRSVIATRRHLLADLLTVIIPLYSRYCP